MLNVTVVPWHTVWLAGCVVIVIGCITVTVTFVAGEVQVADALVTE